jgi:probable F420-dependent oxidoreductase
MTTVSGRGRAVAATLGRIGAWSFALQAHAAAEEQAAASELEAVGYPVVWIPESLGSKEVLSHAGILLAGTRRIAVATGIANIYGRDPEAAANGANALGEAYPGRFVLGLGVSHAPSVAQRGATYGRPVERMREYLDAMDRVRSVGPIADPPVPRVLAALGPRMLELAAERADGAHPYFVPVEHTFRARAILGPEPFLGVEQTVVMERDPARARGIARAFASRYLALPNYANNLRRLGYEDADFPGDGSDRLIDAVIAWGDADAIVDRVRQHLDAGADHVCVQVRAADPRDMAVATFGELWEALAPLG